MVSAGLILVMIIIFLKWKRGDAPPGKVRKRAADERSINYLKQEGDTLVPESQTQSGETSCDVENQPPVTQSEDGERGLRDQSTNSAELLRRHHENDNVGARISPATILEQELCKASVDNTSDDECLLSVDNESEGRQDWITQDDQSEDWAFGQVCMYEGVDYSEESDIMSSQGLKKSIYKEQHATTGPNRNFNFGTSSDILHMPLDDVDEGKDEECVDA